MMLNNILYLNKTGSFRYFSMYNNMQEFLKFEYNVKTRFNIYKLVGIYNILYIQKVLNSL